MNLIQRQDHPSVPLWFRIHLQDSRLDPKHVQCLFMLFEAAPFVFMCFVFVRIQQLIDLFCVQGVDGEGYSYFYCCRYWTSGRKTAVESQKNKKSNRNSTCGCVLTGNQMMWIHVVDNVLGIRQTRLLQTENLQVLCFSLLCYFRDPKYWSILDHFSAPGWEQKECVWAFFFFFFNM